MDKKIRQEPYQWEFYLDKWDLSRIELTEKTKRENEWTIIT